MRNREDISGNTYGLLTAIRRLPHEGHNTFWECRCACGNICSVRRDCLTRGITRSCGCQKVRTTHGHSRAGRRNPAYSAWCSMRTRCDCKNNKSYEHYGARGIRYCPRWEKYENFLEDMGERPPGTSLDRIDNSQGYEPGNCRWADATEQNRNRRNVLRAVYLEKEEKIVELCERLGLSAEAFRARWNSAGRPNDVTDLISAALRQKARREYLKSRRKNGKI
jgi:hypothetical protein